MDVYKENNMAQRYAYAETGDQIRDAADSYLHSGEVNVYEFIYWCERFGLSSEDIIDILKEELAE
jgi:hypothetical protein